MSNSSNPTPSPTPIWKSILGSAIASALAYGGYWLTSAIATTYAQKPIQSTKAIAVSIASAVRTLVVGASAMATFVFAMAAVGLLALTIQTLVQGFRQKPPSSGGVIPNPLGLPQAKP
ncbi:MAG: DUF3082 domain-containing protein, partial [Anaerolineae bacterium]|nr:DUF3082 domain-containing protein [Anaerolineae bacterium]